VRVGFDGNRSLGAGETGGGVALPMFKEIALRVYAEKLVRPAQACVGLDRLRLLMQGKQHDVVSHRAGPAPSAAV
jgi:membrane carboxypeptidase/penicillin-binding protein